MAQRKNRSTPCCDTAQNRAHYARADQLHPFEGKILTIARCFFQTFACPGGQSWMDSFKMADVYFKSEDAAQMALGILNIVQTMRIARNSTFQFSNPLCPGCARLMTETERQLTSALSAVRLGQRSTAHIHALLLTEGNDTGPMLNAMQELCAYAEETQRIAEPILPEGKRATI